MIRNLTLKQVANLVVVALTAGGISLLLNVGFLDRQAAGIYQAWIVFQAERSEKSRLELALRPAIGYGGMIHSFKNYLLRNDPVYLARTSESLGAAYSVLDQYTELGLTPGEDAAIQDIRAALKNYDAALDVIKKGFLEGLASEEIDRLVETDDSRALRGLSTLRAENQSIRSALNSSTDRIALTAELRSALGYGGMIHAFNNFVLRHKPEDQAKALAKADEALATIGKYQALPPSVGERAALDDIQDAVIAYKGKIAIVAEMAANNSSAVEIDRVVRVDDSLALRGLATLNHAIALIVDEKAREISSGLEDVRQVAHNSLIAIALGFIALALFLVSLIYRHLIVPIRSIARTTTDLAGGDVSVSIGWTEQGNEIGALARAVEVFRNTTIRSKEAEQSLAISNEELNNQVAVLKDLKDRTEQQAAQAVALAEKLTRAHDEASNAVARAEADEFRIRSILQTVTDAIITISDKGIVETLNSAAERIFGYHESEVVGRNISMLMPEPHRSAHDGYIGNFLSGKPTRLVGKTVEQVALRKDGTLFPIDLSVNPMRIGGEIKFTGVVRDITDRKEAEAEIRRLALTDPLTGLANRNQFSRKLDDAFRIADRQGSQVALLLIDLDKFKPVNDTYGHPAGDDLLNQVSGELIRQTREVDVVARLGGDEFAILLFEPESREAVGQIAGRIVEALATPFSVLEHQVKIGASIGIAFHPSDAQDQEDLFRLADIALYAAKADGRNTFRFHEQAQYSALKQPPPPER